MSKLKVKEVLMPCATRIGVFANTLKAYPEMFVATTNKMVLAPTAEDIALRLPNALSLGKLYQIQLKFRNELRSSPSLIRGCEFIMKDCYMFFSSKRVLLAEFKLVMAEYQLVFRTLGVRSVVAISGGGPLTANHSFEFVTANRAMTNTSCCVHAHSLVVSSARYLNFTTDYAAAYKVLTDRSYLQLTGLELAHTFMFSKAPQLNVWFASFGIGVSRLLGYTLKSVPRNSDLTAVCNSVVLNVAAGARTRGYARYVYCVLRCTALDCALFEAKAHVSVLLGTLKRLPPKLVIFVNVPVYKFLVCAEPQMPKMCALRRASDLQCALTLAHTIEKARVC
ncbi:MAG: aminoacyl--tRNA ligase-related protein [Candidatus Hodgkinia cicadicola]